MQNTSLNIKVEGRNITIEFLPSSLRKHTIKCTINQFYKKYRCTVEDISVSLVRTMVKDKVFKQTTELYFPSTIKISYNKEKNLKLQEEDGLAHVSSLINPADEYFIPSEDISDFYNMDMYDFEDLKSKRKVVTPLTTNIETNEQGSFINFPLE